MDPARSHRGSRARQITALLAALGAAMPAAADATTPPAHAHLTLSSPAGCASVDAIAAGVRARSPRIAFVSSADGVPNLRVELRAETTAKLVATLTVRWPDGRRSERRVAAESCTDAVETLAFLIVLTLDPSSQAESPAPAAEQAADEPHAGLRFDRVELGVIAPIALGIAPDAMYGVGVRALVALRGPSVWAPALQLRASRLWRIGWQAPGGIADFTLYAFQLDACPIALSAGPLTSRACLAAALGDLTATGSETFAAQSHSELWADWGATLALQLDLPVQVGVNVGLLVPFQRDRYAFRPTVFHEQSAVCFAGDVSVGMRFP